HSATIDIYTLSLHDALPIYKDLENYLNNVELEKITANTISSKEKLREEIEKIRAAGYSISESENFDHTKGFSNPIYDYNGNIVRSEEHTSELQSRFDLVCRL